MTRPDPTGTRSEALAAVTRTSRDLAAHATPDGIHADRLAGTERAIAPMLTAYTEALHAAETTGAGRDSIGAAIRAGIDTAGQQRRLETATRALHNAFDSGQTLDVTDLVADYGAAEHAAATAGISTRDIGTIIETVLDHDTPSSTHPAETPRYLPTAAEEARRLAALSQPTPAQTALIRNADTAEHPATRRSQADPTLSASHQR